MYEKNLTESFRLRLTKEDMDFLTDVSVMNGITVSETIRQILANYRHSRKGVDVHGDTKTFINDIV